jgi:DNA-binding response OmpR family regulator
MQTVASESRFGRYMTRKVAVVEDEAELATLIEYNLTRGGFQTRLFNGSENTFRDLENWQPDLIVLDVMLPDRDGFDLCRRLRQGGKLRRTPVIFLTARSEEVDRVLGLEIGGDDYMTKPFSPRELVARIKAHLRRLDTDSEPNQTEISAGPFRVDSGARRVFQNDREVELTSTEFKLLEFFLTHTGNAWSREQLLREVWGEQHFVTPRTVDVHIRRLREQIEEKPDEPAFLVTVRGFGYRFEVQ